MNQISDYERELSLELTFPAEFKFTKGSWESEGIVKSLSDNPNIRLEDESSKSLFTIKTWTDNIEAEKLGLDYDIQFIESKLMSEKRMLKVYLPQNYTPTKKYPVIYLTDGQSQNFEVAKGYINALSQSAYNIIPESILVGIFQEKRNDDFYGKGSGKYFTDFIIEEAVPYIDAKYNTSGFNAMIGHSNGAEYNHVVMLKENNPFRGFISMSTYLRDNDKTRLSEFFKNYDGNKIYYYLANSTLDAPSRHEFGNEFEKIYQSSPNDKIQFVKNTVKGNHQTIVPNSLLEGLKFTFQDYNNIEKYASIIDLDKNYLVDLKKNYGIDGHFTMTSIDSYYMDIIQRKNKKEWEYFLGFIEKYGLWFGRGLDPVNIANGYFAMEMYPETIESYNKAIEEFETVEPVVFYSNIFRAVRAYKTEGKIEEAISFLERSREVLSDEYYLRMSYRIAKLSLKNNIKTKKGKKALAFCESNFKENKLFSKEDLNKLKG